MRIPKPFFSIIIPCLDSKPERIVALLGSIEGQGMGQDTEVIIVDDGSSEKGYLDIVQGYRERLNVTILLRPPICRHGPGGARQAGLANASGEWIAFADHDDEFLPNALPAVKKNIEQEGEEYLFATRFCRGFEGSEEVVPMEPGNSWCHGKFFNRENLIDAFGIRFLDGLETHEDIAFYVQCLCAMMGMQREVVTRDIFTYKWILSPESESMKKYRMEADGQEYEASYLVRHFKDYLASTAGVAHAAYRKGQIKAEDYAWLAAGVALHSFFYIDSVGEACPKSISDGMISDVAEMVKEAENEAIGFSSDFVRQYAAMGEAAVFQNARRSAEPMTGYYIPRWTLDGFLSLVDDAGREERR